MELLKNKKINLVLLLGAFASYLLLATLGIGDIGKVYSWWSSGPYYSYDLYGNCLGVIFMPIAGGLFLILVPLTLMHYYDKLKYVRVHKFMSFVDFLGIFGVCLAQGILILCYTDSLTVLGVFTNIFLILTCVFSMASALLCLLQLFTMPRYMNEKQEKAIKAKESNNAVQKLKTLKALYDEGAITEEEYNEKKQKYIDLL